MSLLLNEISNVQEHHITDVDTNGEQLHLEHRLIARSVCQDVTVLHALTAEEVGATNKTDAPDNLRSLAHKLHVCSAALSFSLPR